MRKSYAAVSGTNKSKPSERTVNTGTLAEPQNSFAIHLPQGKSVDIPHDRHISELRISPRRGCETTLESCSMRCFQRRNNGRRTGPFHEGLLRRSQKDRRGEESSIQICNRHAQALICDIRRQPLAVGSKCHL